MLLKKQLLSADNLNAAFLSLSSTANQTIKSALTVSGGAVTLTNTLLSDNSNSAYFRIDPQGNNVIIYDGVNNQQLSVYSSSGSEYTYITTINAASNQSIGLIDVAGTSTDHIEIGTNSGKQVKFPLKGIAFGTSATASDNFHIASDTTNGRALRFYNGNYGAGTFLMSIMPDGKVGIGRQPGTYKLEVEGDMLANQGWFRSSGDKGWYSETYAGGIYMTDTTWVRTYNAKGLYTSTGAIRTDGTLQVGNAGATLSVTSGGNFAFDTNVLFANASNNRVGVNTSAPGYAFDVVGDSRIQGAFIATGAITASNFQSTSTLANSVDLNTVINSGFYRLGSAHVNAPGGVDYGQMIVSHANGDTILQIVSDYAGINLYYRSGNPTQVGGTGSYSAWFRINTSSRTVLPVGTNLWATS